MVSSGSLPQVDSDSDSISYRYPRDIVNMVYRTSPTLILNDMNIEETRVLLLEFPPRSPPTAPGGCSRAAATAPCARGTPAARSPLRGGVSPPRSPTRPPSHSPSYIPNQQHSRGASSSCSIGDPNEELNTSGSPLPITSEPIEFHVSTIYVPRARLNELEELERNLSTIVGNGLMEYIYNENMMHTGESLQTSPDDSDNDTVS